MTVVTHPSEPNFAVGISAHHVFDPENYERLTVNTKTTYAEKFSKVPRESVFWIHN
jgi:hypothetical protein